MAVSSSPWAAKGSSSVHSASVRLVCRSLCSKRPQGGDGGRTLRGRYWPIAGRLRTPRSGRGAPRSARARTLPPIPSSSARTGPHGPWPWATSAEGLLEDLYLAPLAGDRGTVKRANSEAVPIAHTFQPRAFQAGAEARPVGCDAHLTLCESAHGAASRQTGPDLGFSETRSGRHPSGDASCGVCGDPGEGGEGRLSCCLSHACAVRWGRGRSVGRPRRRSRAGAPPRGQPLRQWGGNADTAHPPGDGGDAARVASGFSVAEVWGGIPSARP